MEGVLPEEFPFSARHPIAAPAPTPAPAPDPAPIQSASTVASNVATPEPKVARVEEDPLVEIVTSGKVIYRGKERRRSPRQALRAKAVYRDDTNTASSGPVQVINISMFGVRVWSTRPLQTGGKGGIRLELGPVKWSSMIRIVSVESSDDDGYVVGCEFVAKELPRRRVDAA
jgi:hypothetical protein